MEKNRDDVLNDLIKYYDVPDADDSEMGATRIIQSRTPDKKEEMGNTVVVAAKSKHQPAEGISNETVRIDALTDIKESEAPTVVEEVLGNLDINGMPIISAIPKTQFDPEPIAAEPPAAPRIDEITDPAREEALRKRRGVWYSLKPLWVTVILCAITLAGIKFYVTDNGIIGTYKRNFNYNMGLICNMLGIEWNPLGRIPAVGMSSSKAALLAESTPEQIEIGAAYTERDNEHEQTASAYSAANEAHTIPFAEAGNSEISVVGGGIVCAKSNYLCQIGANGEVKWETDTSISNPLLSTCGKYIAVASDGGTQLSLYKKNNLLFSVEVSDKIRACKVSARGDTVLITDRPSYKGAVVLINRKGEKVFSWSSGVNYITAVNVLKNRRIAVALVSAAERITSYVMLFDIKSTDPLAGAQINDSLIYTLDTNGKSIFANGDNSVALITARGSVEYDIRYDSFNISHTANDLKGSRLVAFTNENMPVMNLYNKNGALTHSCAPENMPDYVDVCRATVLYNNGRDIICGRIDAEKKTLYTASRTIKALKLINQVTYAVVYDDGIEIISI